MYCTNIYITSSLVESINTFFKINRYDEVFISFIKVKHLRPFERVIKWTSRATTRIFCRKCDNPQHYLPASVMLGHDLNLNTPYQTNIWAVWNPYPFSMLCRKSRAVRVEHALIFRTGGPTSAGVTEGEGRSGSKKKRKAYAGNTVTLPHSLRTSLCYRPPSILLLPYAIYTREVVNEWKGMKALNHFSSCQRHSCEVRERKKGEDGTSAVVLLSV